jgi:tRNA U55 pseudouridine synthase TruB
MVQTALGVYRAEFRFGAATPTRDITDTVIARTVYA